MHAITIYMGDICKSQTQMATAAGIQMFFRVTPADFPSPSSGAAMRATTAGRMPFENTFDVRIFFKLGKNDCKKQYNDERRQYNTGSGKQTSFKSEPFISYEQRRV